jgi:hypothetical protein
MKLLRLEPVRHVKMSRMLESDVRPPTKCCGHHSLAHDSFGCLITGCACSRLSEAEALNQPVGRRSMR